MSLLIIASTGFIGLAVIRLLIAGANYQVLNLDRQYAVRSNLDGLPEVFIIGEDFIGYEPDCLVFLDSAQCRECLMRISQQFGKSNYGKYLHDLVHLKSWQC